MNDMIIKVVGIPGPMEGERVSTLQVKKIGEEGLLDRGLCYIKDALRERNAFYKGILNPTRENNENAD